MGEKDGVRANTAYANVISLLNAHKVLAGFVLQTTYCALLAAQTALGRIGGPEDVARVVVSLLSEDSGRFNAQDIEVGGGYDV